MVGHEAMMKYKMEYRYSMRHMEHVTFKPVDTIKQLINKGINLNIVNKVSNN